MYIRHTGAWNRARRGGKCFGQVAVRHVWGRLSSGGAVISCVSRLLQ